MDDSPRSCSHALLTLSVDVDGPAARASWLALVGSATRVDTIARLGSATRVDTIARLGSALRLDTIARLGSATRLDTIARLGSAFGPTREEVSASRVYLCSIASNDISICKSNPV